MSASLGDMCWAMSNPVTEAAMSLRSLSVENSVMNETPDRPASRLAQNVGTSFPTGETTPSPVMATRRRMSDRLSREGGTKPCSGAEGGRRAGLHGDGREGRDGRGGEPARLGDPG